MTARSILTLAVVVLAAGVSVACEPPPARLTLSVTTEATGADDDPGDGVCSSTAAAGGCTLQAAIEEGNEAASGADISVGEGVYGGFDPTVTGDVRINWDQPKWGVDLADVHVTVAPGAHLGVDHVRTQPYDVSIGVSHPLTFDVHGTLALRRSLVESAWILSGGRPARPALRVFAGGWAVLSDSLLVADDGVSVDNHGVVVGWGTTIDSIALGTAALHTGPGGSTHLFSSIVQESAAFTPAASCTGIPPVSHGHLHLEQPCGGVAGAGDTSGPTGLEYFLHDPALPLPASSPLIDAIPLGSPGCTTQERDVRGSPRGVDGNGDGVPGCDVGAVERWS